MSSIEISDDDDSFNHPSASYTKNNPEDSIVLSSDRDEAETDHYFTSDENSDLPVGEMKKKRSALIKKLFPNSNCEKTNDYVPPPPLEVLQQKPKGPEFHRMIEGVDVVLPVNPYGCQVALISMTIKAIKRGQNCLLESPTGSGKTLALLCGVLGWQNAEKNNKAQMEAQRHVANHPQLQGVDGAKEYIASPVKKFPEIFFSKTTFGEKSIYDKPPHNGSGVTNVPKRPEPLRNSSLEDSPVKGEVRIHKKRRLDSSDSSGESSVTSPKKMTTPEKKYEWSLESDPDSPQSVRVPTIYYGARTHKQIQQVIKEFKRTAYCGPATMTVLASRDYSCVRDFDKQMWGTKNDMCRGCVKQQRPINREVKKEESQCKYYDNRAVLNHRRLPPAFDLEELVKAGEELTACPYYAAREMAATADIVFCPYNYLIEPSIRNSMRIDLTGNIVIIDEAHNIEDICRDAATFTFTRDQIQAAIKELEVVAEYRYSNQDVFTYTDALIRTLKNWDDWFVNQTPLVGDKPVNNNEAVHTWKVEHFVDTLNSHNIGHPHYKDFKENSETFCRRLREDPRTLLGVTQATGTLLESIDIAFGYLFREDCKYMDDFKPALIRHVAGNFDRAGNWRKSHFNKFIEKESLSLKLMCMNPAVVFEGLKVARCIILASGTLTPLISLHSELGTQFGLQVSPPHVIPSDRVWVGSLRSPECRSRDTERGEVQDALGRAVARVCRLTPHGVLCFLPSYLLVEKLLARWKSTGVYKELNQLKHVFRESRNVKDHNDIMEDYYKYAKSDKGAVLFAVYRGKVSEGMDFKDHQARAVIVIGVPYPNTFDMAVRAKMDYNDKYAKERKLLTGQEWLKVQAYRALNQAVGRCVRHRADWGAVLLVDARFQRPAYTDHLSKWARTFLGNNHHTFESLIDSPNSLESFMQIMKIREDEDL